MRLRGALTLLLCLPFACLAQYSNDWVQPGQQYLKISVAGDGIYRLTYSDLSGAGMPVSAIDPRLIQLFHRGVEQAILFKHNQVPADATFEMSEYLEFYAKRNDGSLDVDLYLPESAQPHQLYNLFSDTSAYFLTWNASPVQGKRMELFDQVNSTNIPVESAQTRERQTVYFSEYAPGITHVGTIQQSTYTTGEGWTGNTICTPNCATNFRDFVFSQVTNTVISGGLPHIEMMAVGRDVGAHQLELYAGADIGSLRLIIAQTFGDFHTTLVSHDLNWSDVGAGGNIVFRVRAVGVGGARDRLSVSYINFSYPANFDLGNAAEQKVKLMPNVGGKSYVEFANHAAGTRVFDITDPSNAVVIGTRTSGALLTAVVPNTTAARTLLCTNTFRSLQPTQLQKITFRNLERPAAFIIISHPSLTTGAPGYANPVRSYADYRASQQGGGYDTLVVTIDELYNQFNYGERSPRAVKEFMRMMVGIGEPKYLFLIGKGRDHLSQYWRRVPAPGELSDLVPTGGSPASDAVFTIGLKQSNLVPSVPVGRLPATTPAQVAAYLDKIKEIEAAAGHAWQKNVLHLSGGIQPNELVLFRTYTKGFGNLAEQKYLGGRVTTLGKHSVSPVEFINISGKVNEGVNIVTFFGHSSSNATDIDIGKATDPLLGYNNKGKYPILLVNGCYAGEFFSNGVNFGEDWILAKDKGARNFMANSSFGLDGVLKLYTDLFYQQGFGDSTLINKGVGDVQVAIARQLLDDTETPTFNSAQVQQVVLLGDPSVKLLEANKPDFSTSDGSISVSSWDNEPLHALTDSLKVSVIAGNGGKVSDQPLLVRLIHTKADGVAETDTLVSSPLNADTIHLTLRRGVGNFFGTNTIQVILDPLNDIQELNEGNNSGTWTKLIPFNGTQNLQPAPFGIVGTSAAELVFMDTDMLAEERTYDLEIDTAATFNSPFKIVRSIQARILARTSIALLTKDSLVYYWRTRPSGVSNAQWEATSFAFISGAGPGFAQLNFDQLTSNALDDLTPDPLIETLSFEQTSVEFLVRTVGSEHPSAQGNASFQVNNAEYYYSPQQFNCRNNTINLVAFDRSSMVPYLGIPFTFQNSFGRSCGREPMIINSFTSTEVETGFSNDLIQYVNNIKPGDSVVLFSMGDAGFSSWSVSIMQKLAELGVATADITSLQDGEPVIILGRKGAPAGTATIFRSNAANPLEEELQVTEGFTGHLSTGSITSVLIGPSLKWKTVTPRFAEVQLADEFSIDVIGVSRDGQDVLLIEDKRQAFSIDMVNASEYPYLRLKFNSRDEESLTPVDLDYWIVNYDPAPDGLVVQVSPSAPVSVQEGTVLNARFGFVNITTVPFADSLNTELTVFNNLSRTSELFSGKIKGPAPGDTSYLNADIATKARLGMNDITFRVNDGTVIEQYYQNNILELPRYLNVVKDNFNPILDVTIDGRYIANGDLVSANPRIDIKVLDENELLGPLDTTSVALFLTSPCAIGPCSPKRVNFSSEDVVWTSDASTPALDVAFRPKNLAAGIYELRVQGFDKSGNPSGVEPYVISFEVRTETSVTHFPPYPNPSTGAVFFEFQSAGAEAPTGMVLQIFTREGREVARFDETNAVPLHVGLNQLQWSGLDTHGRRLSAGLYLYRLRVYQSGEVYAASGRLIILN